MLRDLWAVLANLGYFVVALWLSAELLRHFRWPGNLGRSLPRLFLAAFVVPSLTFFSSRWMAILAPALLLTVLWLILHRQTRQAAGSRSQGRSEAGSPAARATVWFLAAYILLVPVFWAPEFRYAAAVGLLAGTGMMFGGEVGEACWGANRYQLFGRKGTLEGELFALAVGFASLLLALVYLSALPLREGILLSLLLAFAGLLVKLATPADLGHFTVPVALAGMAFLLSYTGAVNPFLARLLWALGLSGAVAGLGYAGRALTRDGAAAAVGVGTFVVAFGGWGWAIPLVAFFVTGSALSRWKAQRKTQVRLVKGKEGARDAGQVLANGLVAAMAAALSLFWPEHGGLLFLAYLGAVAEAAADTWATEIGVLSPRRPRLILSGVQCPPGTSGGVTPLGWWAAGAGSLFISAVGALSALPFDHGTVWRVAIPAVAGLVGAFMDSLVGATAQAAYYCPACAVGAESRRHGCGTPTVLRRGVPWIDNDLVNLIGTLAGALVAAGLAALSGLAGV